MAGKRTADLYLKNAGSARAPESSGTHAWDEYLGKFDVIKLVMTVFFKSEISVDESLAKLQKMIVRDLARAYPEVDFFDKEDLLQSLKDVYAEKKTQFVIVIDEWESVFREYQEDKEGQRKYLDFLRDWLKDKEYIALAYMTGILPIQKRGMHSALSMFDEYSMTSPMQLVPYTGFTENEVEGLCKRVGRDIRQIRDWYDGYRVSTAPEAKKVHLYCPVSVVKAMRTGYVNNYWNETETYEALQRYIDWDADGLKEDVAVLMEGGKLPVDITGCQNELTTFHSKDDILTLLIHLGYLGYDSDTKEVFIPNREVLDAFKSSTKSRDWTVIFRALHHSRELLEAIWNCDGKTVAELLEAAHDKAGNKTYPSEAGISCAVQLAYYAARDDYAIIPEPAAGKGVADLAFIPLKPAIPALWIELKDAEEAIIRNYQENYPDSLERYKGNLILVRINYDRNMSNERAAFTYHSCEIEKA